MQILHKSQGLGLYSHIVDKLQRLKLLPTDFQITMKKPEEIDNELAAGIVPRIGKLLDRSLYDMYQVLYDIDVNEEEIKAKILDLKTTAMIPSIMAFMIIDRLKRKYGNYLRGQ